MRPDHKIIQGIAAHDNSTLKEVYQEMLPYVEAYVIHHGGTTDQARDLFQEAMIIIYRKIEAGNLELHCKFSTYLYAVCKRLWIQDRKKHFLRANKLKEISAVSEPETPYGREDMDEARELFEKHFNALGPDCQLILSMHFNGLTIEEIRKAMGISTVHHASDKKYRCKKKLIDAIKADPLFRKFKK
ncbi:MAG: sigma-70 family RNA polymerase sigma factor [Bacteroidales bacterium]|nr:sigma-70 family RNA polymerase sigma factor [Bacteroidales bacterium]MDT8429971.1 sigma-70 family RNA polymerase sigma factor [Bacteroidales bacterium]